MQRNYNIRYIMFKVVCIILTNPDKKHFKKNNLNSS